MKKIADFFSIIVCSKREIMYFLKKSSDLSWLEMRRVTAIKVEQPLHRIM